MGQYGWDNCPAAVRAQVNRLVADLQACLADTLIGIYLHGSLATGVFNPLRSDLDLLVVVRESLSVATQRGLAELLLRLSLDPRPIEISILRQADFVPWQYPTPYDFHYSEAWRDTFLRALETGAWESWNDVQRYDEDLGAHITVTRCRGLALYGPAAGELFPPVPKRDFVDSILSDVLSPIYGLASNLTTPVNVILNACRSYAYFQTGQVLSKDEGGRWALQVLPPQFHAIVGAALEAYRNCQDDCTLDREAVVALVAYLRAVLAPYENLTVV